MLVFHYARRGGGRGPLFALAGLCGLSFALNLALALGWFGDAWWPLACLALTTGALPPVLWHLVWDPAQLPRWRWTVIAFYGVAITVALLRAASEMEWLSLEVWDAKWLLAAAGVLGLAADRFQRTDYGVWLRPLLALLCLPLFSRHPAAAAAPDYAVLAFFGVMLYYRERLLFFDVVLRGGAYFAVGLVPLAAWGGARDLGGTLSLLLVWMAAPALFRLATYLVDRHALGRSLPFEEAEREFWRAAQGAATEEALQRTALATLSRLFQTTARLDPVDQAGPAALRAPVDGEWLILPPRPNGMPYWSEDPRLLESLARAYVALRDNVRLREREQDLRLLASRAELRALRAQINPHFLFNSLNAIAGLIHREPDLADATIERLAEVFRYTLRRASQEWVRGEEELDFVQAYLAVQQARYRERLRVDWQADDGFSSATLPAMMLQPLVENAIVHGTSRAGGVGELRLCFTREGNRLRAVIENNGPGFAPDYDLAQADSTRGLRNISDRLRAYYGEAATLRWLQPPGGGTMMTWEIPAERPF
ncbi:MAG: histidine kinase [Bryobacteraceae bacterium]|nr:histidine kinase [Bryobacteraceae bacterium]